MKIISEITVALKKATLSQLVEKFSRSGGILKSLSLYDSENYESAYMCEVIYRSSSQFLDCVESFKNSDKFIFISTNLSFEKTLVGGLLNVSGKLPFDTLQDYEINVLGGAEIVNDKIMHGNEEFCGIENITANVCAVTGRGVLKNKLYPIHTIAERDSLIMKKFTGINCVPLSFRSDYPEDCLRHLRNSSVGFKGMRILDVEGATSSFYSQLLDDFPLPLIIRKLDEMPLYILSLVNKCMRRYRFNPDETNIGILGIDSGVVRLTRLFIRMGFSRVLGYDADERMLLEFENEDGLATTRENILENADLIIIVEDNFDEQDLDTMRPGQIVISVLRDNRINKEFFSNSAVKEFVRANYDNLAILFPGLLHGLINAGLFFFDDTRLVELGERIAKFLSDDYSFPESPENIIKMISDFIVLSSYPQSH